MLIICPNCREELDVPDELRGRSIRCGSCQTIIPASAQTQSEHATGGDSDSFDGAPSKPSRREPPIRIRRDAPLPRKPGSLLWLWLLLTFFGLGVFCCGGIGIAVYFGIKPKWQTYTSDEKLFSIEFPAPPKDRTNMTGVEGLQMVGCERIFGREAYLVGWKTVPEAKNARLSLIEETLNQACDEAANNEEITETARRSITYDNYPGKEIKANIRNRQLDGQLTLRVYLIDEYMIMLLTVGAGDGPDEEISARFFDSFKYLKKQK